jgi:hypothetical protein
MASGFTSAQTAVVSARYGKNPLREERLFE